MLKKNILLLFLSLFTLQTASTENISLADALRRTARANPRLAAQSWELKTAAARIRSASERPNPEVSLEGEDFAGSGDFQGLRGSQTTLQLSQLIELGGKRPARLNEAERSAEVAQISQEVARMEALRATATAFIEVLTTQKRLFQSNELLQLAESFAPAIARRVEAGKASTVEQAQNEIFLASARIDREQAMSQLIIAKARLAAQWRGEPGAVDTAVGNLEARVNLPPKAELQRRLLRNPLLLRWGAEYARRTAAVRSEKAKALPDVTLFGGPRASSGVDDVSLVAGLSIPWPIFSKNQGAIAGAEAQASQVQAETDVQITDLRLAFEEAWQRLQRAAKERVILETFVLPKAKEASEVLVQGYDAGRFSQQELLSARRSLAESRNLYLQSLTDYHTAIADLEALTGAPLNAFSK